MVAEVYAFKLNHHDLHIDELKNLFIKICKPHSRSFIVVNWYRPPNSPTGLFSHLEILSRGLI